MNTPNYKDLQEQISALTLERDALKGWKEEAKILLDPIMAMKPPEVKLGECKVAALLRRSKELDEAVAALASYKQTHEKLVDDLKERIYRLEGCNK